MRARSSDAPHEREIRRRKAAITRALRKEVIVELGLDKLPKQGERTLVTGAQGTGKSRTCAETIAKLPRGDLSFWWLVPSLRKAEEQAGEYDRLRGPDSMVARVVRGRGANDPRQDGQAMCPRDPVVNRAAAMGVNVQEAICDNGCALRSSCGFQKQATALRETPAGLFLMASDYLWLPCPAPGPDLLIVDESVVDKAREVTSFDPSRIVADDLWAGGALEEAMQRRRLASLIRTALVGHPTSELAFLREHGVTVDGLGEAIKHLASREEAQPVLDGRMSDAAIASILDAVEAREILKVLRLFRQIRLELPLPRARLSSVSYQPDAPIRVGGEVERAPRVFVRALRTPRLAKEVPVIALDGTGSLELNRQIFGEEMTIERFAVPRNAEVIQVTSRVFSRQSLTGTDPRGYPISDQKMRDAASLRRQVLDLLRMLPGEVLLVTYKAVEDVLRPDLPPHVQTAHFGGLRGLNSYEHCETAVVLGREQPSAQEIEALTRPFCATDVAPFIPIGDYVVQSRGRRMRNGGANVVEVRVHPDARCQAMLEQVREAEIAQAIDRVRPVHNRRRIIVLTNIPLDLTVDHALSWPELRPGKFAHAFAQHGVLPLSAGDLCRAFPGLWRSQNTAKSDLARSRLIGCNLPIIYFLGVCTPLDQAPFQAIYRRKGQKGKPARALVRADLPDPRAVLGRLVGELTEFRLQPSPEPVKETGARESATRSLPPLPRSVAALSAETHLLATLPPDARPPDGLGMARVIRLMALANDPAGTKRPAVA